MTLAEAIYQAAQKLSVHGISTARLDAEVLLSHTIMRDRAWLIIHRDESLNESQRTLFEDAVNRRARREPLQYITGKQEFWGLDFSVTPDVLIPRPETELVVEAALKIIQTTGSQVTIIDLCAGSGCIAVSLAKGPAAPRIFAIDKSDRALAVARENARKHNVSDRIRFLEGDLFGPLAELDLHGMADIIVSNPPYVRSGDLPALQPEVRDFEPELALLAGPEGTEIQQRIVGTAPEFLKKYGALIMEMGQGQSGALTKMVNDTGRYEMPEIMKDLAGIERVIVARKK
ncbi:MAG: peptide chain release factor N(5)-glutamine methyltransferase [Nitrospirota bacterium]